MDYDETCKPNKPFPVTAYLVQTNKHFTRKQSYEIHELLGPEKLSRGYQHLVYKVKAATQRDHEVSIGRSMLYGFQGKSACTASPAVKYAGNQSYFSYKICKISVSKKECIGMLCY